MRVFREEIFGPVLVAMPFADEAEAIRLANATQYGLAAYVWTSDIGRAHRVAHAIDTGLCWINSQNVRDLRTPFGGVKQSGVGREGGDYAFEFYCELETVHVALRDHPIPRLGLRPMTRRQAGAHVRDPALADPRRHLRPGAAARDRRAGARPRRQPDAGARGDPPARGRGLAHLPAPPGRAGRAARRGRLDGGADARSPCSRATRRRSARRTWPPTTSRARATSTRGMREALEALDVMAVSERNLAFHRALIERCPNALPAARARPRSRSG